MTNTHIYESAGNFELSTMIPHCPVMMVLDTSHSMWGKGLSDLKDSLQTFFQTIDATDLPESMIDIAAVSMGDRLCVLEEFTPAEYSSLRNFTIRPKGNTPIGAALDLALNEIRNFGASYKRKNIQGVLTPHLIILSDGISSDDFSRQAALLREMKRVNGLYCTAVALGERPDLNALRSITCDVLVAGEDNLRTAFAMVGRIVSQCCEDALEDMPEVITVEAVAEDVPRRESICLQNENSRLHLLDGSNIIHWDHSENGVSLSPVIAITEELERRGERYQVFFDATAKHLFKHDPVQLAKYENLLKDSEHFQQVPAGSRADDFLLVIAQSEPGSVILTQDRYRDYEDQYPEIVNSDRIVPGMMLRNMIFFPKINLQILLS